MDKEVFNRFMEILGKGMLMLGGVGLVIATGLYISHLLFGEKMLFLFLIPVVAVVALLYRFAQSDIARERAIAQINADEEAGLITADQANTSRIMYSALI